MYCRYPIMYIAILLASRPRLIRVITIATHACTVYTTVHNHSPYSTKLTIITNPASIAILSTSAYPVFGYRPGRTG